MPSKLMKENGVNLFISQQEIDKNVSNKDDSSTAYIILQNNILQDKFEKISKKLYETTSIKDIMEDDNDRLEKAKICLQGYVKNYYTLSNNLNKIADVNKQVTKTFKKISIESNITTILILFTTHHFTLYINSIITSLLIVIYSFVLYEDLYFIKSLKKDVHFQKMLEENKEINNSSKMLDEIIDNF